MQLREEFGPAALQPDSHKWDSLCAQGQQEPGMGPTLGNSCWNRQFCWSQAGSFPSKPALEQQNWIPAQNDPVSLFPPMVSLGELSFVLSFKAGPMSLPDQWNNRSGGGAVKSIATECEAPPSPADRSDVLVLRKA